MTFVICQSTSTANWSFAILAKKTSVSLVCAVSDGKVLVALKCSQSLDLESLDWKILSTFGTFDSISVSARSLNPVQTVQAKTVQARQLLWISELAHAHKTADLFMEIV